MITVCLFVRFHNRQKLDWRDFSETNRSIHIIEHDIQRRC